MTCRKAKKLIPLYAGDDLRPRLAKAVLAHVDACSACAGELREFRAAIASVKAAAKEESVSDWSDGEWKALMARIRTTAHETERPVVLARPRWVSASVLGIFLGLAVLSMLFRRPSLQPGRTSDEGRAIVASQTPEQDKVAVTMVSTETGLQVVWFLDKNFDWKGENE